MIVFLVLYVNDMLIIGNDLSNLQLVKVWLPKCFFKKNLEEAAYVLGIKIYQDKK